LTKSDEEITDPYLDKDGIFLLRESTWNILRQVESEFGFFKRLDSVVDVRCGTCGSFSLSSRNFIYALEPNLREVLQLDLDSWGLSEEVADFQSEELWPLLRTMTEEKLISDEEWGLSFMKVRCLIKIFFIPARESWFIAMVAIL
jgi:hypothetical protein